ncbi:MULTISPECIES: hypothetical protein [unclassified Streptomyces]|uniref:hypothetical protein n=1 Tax=unclassified Streptomyces TaxID=2593676 RepID=UPI002E288388|nr:hypothetical protein [Streptomyces sp. NBC_00223]
MAVALDVTATVHVRLRLQRDALGALGPALACLATAETPSAPGDEPPSCTVLVR